MVEMGMGLATRLGVALAAAVVFAATGRAAPQITPTEFHFDSAFNNPALPGSPFYTDIQMGGGCGGTIQGCANHVRDHSELVPDKYPFTPWSKLLKPQEAPTDSEELEPIRVLIEKLLRTQRRGNPAGDRPGNWRGTVLLDEQGEVNPSPGYRAVDGCRAPWVVPNLGPEGPPAWNVWCRFVRLDSGTEFYLLSPADMDDPPHGTIVVENSDTGERIVIKPFSGRVTLDARSSCPQYDADVLVYVRGTTGFPYESPRMPSIEIQTAAMDQQAQLERTKPKSFWFHRGGLVWEALSRGNLVVVPNWQLGQHPIPHSMAELVEIAEFLRSPAVGRGRFYNQFTKTKSGGPLSLRFFCAGASYGGLVALSSALYLPWIFHGAIVQDANPDLRKQISFQAAELKVLQSQSLSGLHFPDWGLLGTPDTQRLLNELSLGYALECGVAGSYGNPVDMLGLSLLGQDIAPTHHNPLPPNIQLTIVNGDEDNGMQRNAGGAIVNRPDASRIEVFSVPMQAHATDSFPDWNEGMRILSRLITRANCQPSPNGPGEAAGIGWERHVGCPGSNHPGAPARSEEDWPLLRRDERPEVNHDPGTLSVTLLDGNAGTSWHERQVWEGLGASGDALLFDGVPDAAGTGALPELYASTTRGDVVCLQLVRTSVDEPVGGIQEVWREAVRDGSTTGGAVFHASSELELSDDSGATRILAFNHFGPVAELDPGSGAPTPDFAVTGDPGPMVKSVEEAATNQYTAVNALGHALEIDRTGNGITVTSAYLEGGVTTLTAQVSAPLPYVYGSAQGNWKTVADPLGGHPTTTQDIGPYLESTPLLLRELAPPTKSAWGVDYLSLATTGPTWRLATIAAGEDMGDWDEVEIILQCTGSAPTQTLVLDSPAGDLDVLLGLRRLPADVIGMHGVDGPGLAYLSLSQGVATTGPLPDFADTETGVIEVASEITRRVTARPMAPNQIARREVAPDRFETVAELIARIPEPARTSGPGASGVSGGLAPPRGTQPIVSSGSEEPPSRKCDFVGANHAYLDLPAEPTSIAEVPAGFSLEGTDPGGDVFPVFAVVTLVDGGVVLIGNPQDVAGPSGARIEHQVLDPTLGGRRPFGSSFGIEAIDEGANRFAVLTREGNVYELDANGVVDPQVDANATRMALDTDGQGTLDDKADRAVHGAVRAHDLLFGMFDGGDVLATANPPLLAFPASDFPQRDPRDDWAGLRVSTLNASAPHFDYLTGDVFESERLLSTAATARPEVVRGGQKGNAAKWADVDGDGDFDVVFAAYGGVLHLFPNASGDPASFQAGTPSPTADLGFAPMSLSAADLDGDGAGDELIVTLRATTDPGQPTELVQRGALVVLDDQGGLVEVARHEADARTGGFVGGAILTNPLNVDPPVDYYLAGSATGRFYLFEITPGLQLDLKYESPYLAPAPGAYGSIAAIPIDSGGEQVGVRLVLCSTGGLFACDLTRSSL